MSDAFDQHDEPEPALAALNKDVVQAEDAMLSKVEEQPPPPDTQWTPRRLQDEARNGWSQQVMSIAFWALVNRRVLVIDDAFSVQRATDADA